MNGINQKNLLYGILGAVAADRKSDTDAKLPRNELMKAGLLNAMGGGGNPMFSMLSAKMSAEDKITAATLLADNAKLIAKIESYRAAVKTLIDLGTQSNLNDPTTYAFLSTNTASVIAAHVIGKFKLDGTLR